MTKSKNNKDDSHEKLKKETEKLKKKLHDEGAVFSNDEMQGNLPPDVENMFYKNIFEFENAYKNARLTTVYNYLGKPFFKKAEELSDKQISKVLDAILDLMDKNLISLDTICEVDHRTLYKFITEELFLYEIEDMRMDGMTTNFIYEEFHPNHEYDIKNHCSDFITSLLHKNEFGITAFLTKESETEGWFKKFTDSYSSFTLKHFEISNLIYDEQKALVAFDIDFTGIIEGTNIHHQYCGQGTADMVYHFDYWCVQRVNFPGGHLP